jgi:hypothetical protein
MEEDRTSSHIWSLDKFSSKNVQIAAVIIAALILRLLWIAYTGYTHEDAFITFRYAQQLAEGNGFVYNLGERIYGTTTPFFTLLLAGWLSIPGSDVVMGARILDLTATLGAFIFAVMTLRRLGCSHPQQVLALSLFSFSSRFWAIDTGGMETPVVIFLMSASWYTLVSKRISWTGVLAGLLLWTRVDLILWPITLVIIEWLSKPKNAIYIVVVTALTYLPWIIFATLYFGSPIPHTVFAKWVAYAQPDRQPLTTHMWTLFKWLTPLHIPDQLQIVRLLLAAGTLGVAVWQANRNFRNRNLAILPIFALLQSGLLVLTRATIFSRYFIPALWAMMLLLGLGLGSMWRSLDNKPLISGVRRLLLAMMVLLVCFMLGFQVAGRAREVQVVRHEAALKSAGLWLDRNSDPEARVQLEPLGYVGYYSNRTILDEVGLVTPRIVELKSQGIVDAGQYITILQPEYFLIHCDDALRMQESRTDDEDMIPPPYALAVVFNPGHFDPKNPGEGDDYDNLGRSSCYEIWERTE